MSRKFSRPVILPVVQLIGRHAATYEFLHLCSQPFTLLLSALHMKQGEMHTLANFNATVQGFIAHKHELWRKSSESKNCSHQNEMSHMHKLGANEGGKIVPILLWPCCKFHLAQCTILMKHCPCSCHTLSNQVRNVGTPTNLREYL